MKEERWIVSSDQRKEVDHLHIIHIQARSTYLIEDRMDGQW